MPPGIRGLFWRGGEPPLPIRMLLFINGQVICLAAVSFFFYSSSRLLFSSDQQQFPIVIFIRYAAEDRKKQDITAEMIGRNENNVITYCKNTKKLCLYGELIGKKFIKSIDFFLHK